VTTDVSEPEPDIALLRGPLPSAANSHPLPSEMGILVEVAESSWEHDRTTKARAYARAAIPFDWIVNLRGGQVEVCTDPTGPAPNSNYRTRRDFAPADSVPLVLVEDHVGRRAFSLVHPGRKRPGLLPDTGDRQETACPD